MRVQCLVGPSKIHKPRDILEVTIDRIGRKSSPRNADKEEKSRNSKQPAKVEVKEEEQ